MTSGREQGAFRFAREVLYVPHVSKAFLAAATTTSASAAFEL
jgi:hypothetical protein